MSSCLPRLFKGIALFTPAGDLIYCIDPSKQGWWHINLCTELQERLGLLEPPHFLVPGYTATIDRWLDPRTQELKTLAELYPPVQRHQTLLNAVFDSEGLIWQVTPWQEESCSSMILDTYRPQFPQLWEEHDLVVRLDRKGEKSDPKESSFSTSDAAVSNYVLRLFISGNSTATEQTLERVHKLLEQGLRSPYTLKIIDVFKHPEQAELNQVSATPTLLRVVPKPVKRIVGSLEDMERVLQIITMS